MRLLGRIIAVVTALCFIGSSSISAMPLVWCVGEDGHRGVETVFHKHAPPVTPSAELLTGEVAIDAGSPAACADWQLLGASAPQVKGGEEGPKTLAFIIAYPPLKLVVARSAPSRDIVSTSSPPAPIVAHLRALRTVVLLI